MEPKHEITLAPTSENDVIASVPREHLKSFFYLFSGKPDSRIKVFSDPVHLKQTDIVELNDCVARKLTTHQIDSLITTVKVGYKGQHLSEFGSWGEFAAHHWQEPECIEEIVMKWDFMMQVQTFAAPQRHTLLVRISTDLKPGKVFQLLVAGNSDQFDQLDMYAAPAFCRVDFINAQISKELINVVDDWYRSRARPQLIPQTFFWLKQRRKLIAQGFDMVLLFSWVLAISAASLWASRHYFDNAVPNHLAALGCFLGIYSLRIVSRIANTMAGLVFNALKALDGSRVVFEFTSGDRKQITEQQSENRRHSRRFMVTSGWNILLNLAATAIWVYCFNQAG